MIHAIDKLDTLLGCENRRIAPRLNHVFSIDLKSDKHDRPSCGLNLSATGLRMVSQVPLGPEGEVELDLNLEADICVSIRGQAVWEQPMGDSQVTGIRVIGIAFAPDQYEEQKRLAHWLHTQGVAA